VAALAIKERVMTQSVQPHPLTTSATRANIVHEWMTVTHGAVTGPEWLLCGDVDARALGEWEALMTAQHLEHYGRSHPSASAGYVLGWYAGVASHLGALFFLLDGRVPRLGRQALAFRRHPQLHHPDAIALLEGQFWCLPTDPAADHPDATVLADQQALANQLRIEVRSHADEFLATYRSGSRLPRRSLLGAFFDGLDGGFWIEDEALASRRDILAAAKLVLPGRSDQFEDATTSRTVLDASGREHLTRSRVSCCYYYKLNEGGEACLTCPRTSDAERIRRLSESAAETPPADCAGA
jgi:hypothetical protein